MERKRGRGVISGQKLTQNHPLNEKSERKNLERENYGRLIGERNLEFMFHFISNKHVLHFFFSL